MALPYRRSVVGTHVSEGQTPDTNCEYSAPFSDSADGDGDRDADNARNVSVLINGHARRHEHQHAAQSHDDDKTRTGTRTAYRVMADNVEQQSMVVPNTYESRRQTAP